MINNRYGVLCDFTAGPEKFMAGLGFKDELVTVANEDLAAKLIFADRIIKVTWQGGIEVEPNAAMAEVPK